MKQVQHAVSAALARGVKMNQIEKALAGLGMVGLSAASNAALDFTAITAAIDATTIVAAISAIAAIRILPGVAKWGYGKVLSWFK